MGKETKVNLLFAGNLLWMLTAFVCLSAFAGCARRPAGPAPSPAIIVTTWETENGPGAKLVYQNHYQEPLGNSKYGDPEITFYSADQVAAYTKQFQRSLDELAQIEDRMRQLEGQYVQEPATDP